MKTYPIRLYGDPVLRQKARPVQDFGPDLRRLADGMIGTLVEAEGAGLAAPQVGVPLRAFVLTGSYAGALDPEEEHDWEAERAAAVFFVNPVIVQSEGVREDVEGCLSIPGLSAKVTRSAHVRLRYQDLEGRTQEADFEGVHAKAVQHEVDHLDGVLYFDRLSAQARREVMDEHRRELAEMQRDAKAHLKELRRLGQPSQPWP